MCSNSGSSESRVRTGIGPALPCVFPACSGGVVTKRRAKRIRWRDSPRCWRARMIPYLDAEDPFPPVDAAMREPNGLLAAGGDLSPERLIDAYRRGIFPWF